MKKAVAFLVSMTLAFGSIGSMAAFAAEAVDNSVENVEEYIAEEADQAEQESVYDVETEAVEEEADEVDNNDAEAAVTVENDAEEIVSVEGEQIEESVSNEAVAEEIDGSDSESETEVIPIDGDWGEPIDEFQIDGIVDKVYTGKAITQKITIENEEGTLTEGTDYTVKYQDNINVGVATVIIEGINDYEESGTVTRTFKILPGKTTKITPSNAKDGMNLRWEAVPGATRYKIYRGNKFLKEVSTLQTTDNEVKNSFGHKYTYKIVATAKDVGDSPVFRTCTYYRLKPVVITQLTNPEAGKMTAYYEKTSGGTGYVVRYGLKADMSDAKVITVQGANVTSRTFANLKKGKLYYVQVRAVRLEDGFRYYSGYCTSRRITIKK